jgi:GR25 family glycosyltransferase involved in LPS biosynthesis
MVSSFVDNDCIFSNVKVITLEKRKEYISNVLTRLGLKYELFDAVLGKNLDLQILIQEGFLDKNHTFKNANEVACYLSHITCVKKFYESNHETLFIFEDDIEFNKDSVANVEKCMEEVPGDWEFINFGRCWAGCYGEESIENPKLIKSSDFLCSHSYAINKIGGKKILDECFPAKVPLDLFYKDLCGSSTEKPIVSYVSSPRIFEQRRVDNSEEFASSLQNNDSCRECKSVVPIIWDILKVATIVLIVLFLIYLLKFQAFQKLFSKRKV